MKRLICLKEVASYSKGKQINGSELVVNGKYKYLNGGIKPSGRWNTANVSANTITISEGGNSSGYVNFMVEPFWCGAHCYYLYDLKCEAKYLYYALKSQQNRLMSIRSGACMPNIKKNDLGDFKILYHDDRITQIEISTTLDKVFSIIEKRNKQLHYLDTLVKARFIEMFGDVYLNTKGWPEKRLDGISSIVSGITKGRKIGKNALIEVPYMAVSNVKDGYIDWTTVKTIQATSDEIEQYRLQPLDVLMTEGGDPDKLGRGAIIHEPLPNCIHQNHVFRVRLDADQILPVFFAEYLQHQKAKRYFLGCAKQTTGIASINKKQLSALPVLCPPVKSQYAFADFVAQIDKSKFAVQKSLDEAQLLFDSLMQLYFG